MVVRVVNVKSTKLSLNLLDNPRDRLVVYGTCREKQASEASFLSR